MLKKLRFLIVSGPTREPIDPVRFISNYSTGVMGRCLVEAARRKGYRVTFVECPQAAETARDLQRKLTALLPSHDVLIMAAAVCDSRPQRASMTKIKKESLASVKLVKNPDILAGLAKSKKKGQVFIGFGLESSKLLRNGRKKLREKNLELIVLQSVRKNRTPFGPKRIKALLLKKDGSLLRFRSISKDDLARVVVSEAVAFSREKSRAKNA